MARENRTVSQPPEWWWAFKKQAKRDGMSLSEYLGHHGRRGLDDDLAKKLPDRQPAHRPRES